MAGKIGKVITVLPVQPPRSDLRLRDQHPQRPVRKRAEGFFLALVGVLAAHLFGVRDQSFEQVAFVVQVAPDDGRLAGIVHQVGHDLAPLSDRAPAFLPFFEESIRRNREEHPWRSGPRFDDVLIHDEGIQMETGIVEPKIGRSAHRTRPRRNPAPERLFRVSLESPVSLGAESTLHGPHRVLVVHEKPGQHVHMAEIAECF